MKKNNIKSNNMGKYAWQIIISIIAIAMAACILSGFGLMRHVCSGDSMYPTLKSGDTFITTGYTGWLKSRQRFKSGDIVSLYIHDDKSETYVKRIIAIPGDKIEIRDDNRVYINGNMVVERYLTKADTDSGDLKGTIIVPEDSYFVMGDNREVSLDSRYNKFGIVNKKNIYGKIIWR